jgi:hypothetical protein
MSKTIQFTLELDVEDYFNEDHIQEALSDALKEISKKVEEGYTSGYHPFWDYKEV